jgi:thiamine-monophosphate kinase
MAVRDEFGTIARYFAPLSRGLPGAFGLRNDGAVIPPDGSRGLVATVDTVVEGVHYLPDDPPELVARKLLRVNLSDLAAMGAMPESYLLTVALDRDKEEPWVERFAAGLAEDQAIFGIGMLGGDTTSTPGPTTLSLAAFGRVADATVLERATAEAGQEVYVSGTLGDGALGLLVRQGRLVGLPEAHRSFLEQRYRLPQPRTALGPRLLGLATACLDVSDGLVGDLAHIAETSGIGIEIDSTAVPLSPAAHEVLGDDPDLWPLVLTGGDDYELAFTAPASAAAALAALAAELELPLTRIGRTVSATGGQGVRVLDRDGRPLELATAGWTHF